MISVFSYNRIAREQDIIEESCHCEVAKRTDDRLSFLKVMSYEGQPETGIQDSLVDIIYYGVDDTKDVESLKALRKNEPNSMLMLLASSKMSPMRYLKPGISPDLLLLRPFGKKDFETVNEELFDAFLRAQDEDDSGEKYTVNSRDGRFSIPYNKILFFEACNKKINVRVGNEEYDFYDSIENIINNVPDYFVRCHRAYLVNTKKMRKVRLSEGLIELEGGMTVPLSRTYKQKFKK